MTPLYQLDSVQQRYASRLALDIPSLAIHAGRIYTLAGPNGSGKTTLLTILGLLSPPSSGEVRFDGERVEWSDPMLPRLRQQITVVHQPPRLFAGTVEENLRLALAQQNLDAEEVRARVAASLEAVGLGGCEARSAEALSHGELQRVAVARAMMLRCRVLLLDEPLASLDRSGIAVLEELITRLREAGQTVIVSSHDADHARRIGSEVIALERGALVAHRGTASVEREAAAEIAMGLPRSGRRPLRTAVLDTERDALLVALDATGWNFARAAQRLGISRMTLYRKLQRHGISRAGTTHVSEGPTHSVEAIADAPRRGFNR